MAQDFYIKQGTGYHDWFLEDGTTPVVCPDIQSLVRQRISINLKMIMGEWFADINYGVPYFESIFGKNTKDATDSIIRNTILQTEGVTGLSSYTSSVDNTTRKITIRFSATTDSGTINNFEVTL